MKNLLKKQKFFCLDFLFNVEIVEKNLINERNKRLSMKW